MALPLSEELFDLLRSVVIFGIVTAVALAVRFFAPRGLNAWGRRSVTRMDDLILENIRGP